VAKELSLMIIAGETSGDIHGGKLCHQILRMNPGAKLFGMGGSRMAEAGVELFHEIGHTGVVGFWEVYKDIGRYRRIFKNLVALLEEKKPDAVVLIDYPGFNIRFARQAHRRGFRVIYYISPQVWAWGKRRIKKLERFVDRMVVIFEFEKIFYRPYRLKVDFVGHPLVDSLTSDLDSDEIRKRFGLEEGPIIGLLPGSRKSEMQKVLPILIRTAREISKQRPETSFLLPLASPELRPLAEKELEAESTPIRILEGQVQPVLAVADLAIMASGTVTLEGAAFSTPMIIVYKLSIFSWIIARLLIKIPYIGLVNVIAGRRIIPEFLQFKARPEQIAREALMILSRPEIRRTMIGHLERVREKLGRPGASARAARAVLNAAGAAKN